MLYSGEYKQKGEAQAALGKLKKAFPSAEVIAVASASSGSSAGGTDAGSKVVAHTSHGTIHQVAGYNPSQQKIAHDTQLVKQNAHLTGQAYVNAQRNSPDIMTIGGDAEQRAPAADRRGRLIVSLRAAELRAPTPTPPRSAAGRGGSATPAGERGSAVGEAANAELRAQRDRLLERFTIMQADLGGAFYEMAIRDHVRLDVLTRKAAELQRVDPSCRRLSGGSSSSAPMRRACARPAAPRTDTA